MALESLSSKGVSDGREFNMVLTQLDNAAVLYLWEGSKPLLGTTSVSLPGSISTRLLGERNALLAQLIGEQISSYFKKMALVSVHLRGLEDEQSVKLVIKLARDLAARSLSRNEGSSTALGPHHV